ncbi:nicotinate-nucleotide--dimethylbenzimidazole phosphoribosyltransferase [Streptomyces marincola]|uniref:nicotinate-nucleotide--dimethylbenzimidazole phosphoribosyltransferase n=1 Tax=Streptomyces marincola TaxID=2878388 RepID=UPI001CF314D3|nr:nicotinate-nucleotide--dimethylbenzimidazole phosphoribosyltransferase [Streptomyces marincola]UCM86849.1 nicotinate-nucleotide--dimethylbenzimidazole phosphoribosyltransferase [Streptomyces marincola]
MTDAGRVPEEGQPEHAGVGPDQLAQPGGPVPAAYPFPAAPDDAGDGDLDEEELLMPGANVAWGEAATAAPRPSAPAPAAAPQPEPAPAVTHRPAPPAPRGPHPTEPEYLDVPAAETVPPPAAPAAPAAPAGPPSPAVPRQAGPGQDLVPEPAAEAPGPVAAAPVPPAPAPLPEPPGAWEPVPAPAAVPDASAAPPAGVPAAGEPEPAAVPGPADPAGQGGGEPGAAPAVPAEPAAAEQPEASAEPVAVPAEQPAAAEEPAVAAEPVVAQAPAPAEEPPAPAEEPPAAAEPPAGPVPPPVPEVPVRQAGEQPEASAEPVAAPGEQPAAAQGPAVAAEPAVAQAPAPAEEPPAAPPQAPAVPGPRPAPEPAAEAEEPQEQARPAAGAAGPPAPGYPESERAAVHRLMRERRDIRNGFRLDPIPNDVLLRVLEAAHTAPSVGLSQPWDFVVVRSAETREAVHEVAVKQRAAYAKSLPKGRAKHFKELKIEAILDTPVNIVVTADPTRGGRHTLGRMGVPQMAPYSSALAVENLWLAARAEGLGVGWVSFFDERELSRVLDLPEHLDIVAYLCVGYVDAFPDEPELAQNGWSRRRPLSWVVHDEVYGRRALPGAEPHDLLSETLAEIRPLDAQALGEAWERQKRMTKPSGALGALEVLAAQLCGLSRSCPPPVPEPAAVAVFAGDHGVHAQGVTPWPQEVTGQMVANFLGGGAVCNAFAAQVGAEVCVVDVGVRSELPTATGLLPRKVRAGTGDITVGPAMTREEALRAVEVGIETARDLVAAGNRALLTGEMGIANTTVSAALVAAFTDADPADVTGRGTGIDDETHARKVDVVRRALAFHEPEATDPLGVLAAVGGLEHAALTGFILGGASLRVPVILDGVTAGAAALAARAIAPEAVSVCIAGHRSAEPGHQAALMALGLRPLVDLDLRLGEGTGALLALPVVQSAARAVREVATFDAAGVTDKN